MFPWNLFPFNKDMQNMLQKVKPDEVNGYVQEIMEKVLPGNMKGMMNSGDLLSQFPMGGQQQPASPLNSAAFETHDYVFVRIPVKNEDWIKKVRICHTSNQLIVERIPEYEDKHTITLPAIVKKKGAVATFKDSMLEVRIPKNVDLQFSEIDVTEI